MWINGRLSNRAFERRSGLMQGALWSPMLFNHFINDLVERIPHDPTQITSPLKLYADDLALLRKSSNRSRLAQDVLEVAAWCSENALEINWPKCHWIPSGNNAVNVQDFFSSIFHNPASSTPTVSQPPTPPTDTSDSLVFSTGELADGARVLGHRGGINLAVDHAPIIARTDQAKYLGLPFSRHGIVFHAMIDQGLATAHTTLATCRSTGTHWPSLVKLNVFKAFIRSQVEFCLGLLAQYTLFGPVPPRVSSLLQRLEGLYSDSIRWILHAPERARITRTHYGILGLASPGERLAELSARTADHVERLAGAGTELYELRSTLNSWGPRQLNPCS